jgi:type IV secretion system protein VirB9
MSVRSFALLAASAALVLVPPLAAQTDGPPARARGARTVLYYPRALIVIRAKLHYTTLLVLPDGEDVVEATCGDKDVWIVNVRGALVSVKPAKAGAETNLNVVTASGQVYAFILTEVSEPSGQDPDFTVYLEPDDPAVLAAGRDHPKYVAAQQVEDFRAQADLAREEARRTTEAARTALENGLTSVRTTYPLGLHFPYRFKADTAPFYVHAMFHDDHLTFIQAHAPELPSLYELKDGAPNLVNFDVRDGTYIVSKILDSGYLMLGKQRLVFQRVEAR